LQLETILKVELIHLSDGVRRGSQLIHLMESWYFIFSVPWPNLSGGSFLKGREPVLRRHALGDVNVGEKKGYPKRLG
jgi:hypothetical protein